MELAEKYDIKLVKIDTNKNKYIPGQYSVFAAPTVLLMHSGGEYSRESRFIDFENIRKNIEYLKGIGG